MSVPPTLRVAYTLEQCWHDVPGGTAVAAIEVARRLAARGDIELVGVAGRHRNVPSPPFTPPVTVHQLPIGRPWLYETWNRFDRPRIERACGPVDVCHSTVAIPAGTRAPHVVTVHDVAFVHHPERFSRHGVRVMTAGLQRCRHATRVLVPSRATRDALVALGFAADRLRVVPWGVEPRSFSDEDAERVRRRYDLPDRYVLFVGTVEPRKNLSRLALATERAGVGPLVVAGAPGWGDIPAPVGDVRFLGFVPDADLGPLYAAAGVFAYPSLEEGFGMPIAEAMAHGAPVVTSQGGATEEVAGGAAVLVEPVDVDSIADGLIRAVADAERLVALARARSSELNWDATVESTVAAYREALEEGS